MKSNATFSYLSIKIYLFSAFLGAPLVLLLKNAPVLSFFYSITDSRFFLLRMTGYFFGSGLLEECAKITPALFFLRGKSLSSMEFASIGMISGISFGLFEFIVRMKTSSELPLLFAVLLLIHGFLGGLSLNFSGRSGRIKMSDAFIGIGLSALIHSFYNSL